MSRQTNIFAEETSSETEDMNYQSHDEGQSNDEHGTATFGTDNYECPVDISDDGDGNDPNNTIDIPIYRGNDPDQPIHIPSDGDDAEDAIENQYGDGDESDGDGHTDGDDGYDDSDRIEDEDNGDGYENEYGDENENDGGDGDVRIYEDDGDVDEYGNENDRCNDGYTNENDDDGDGDEEEDEEDGDEAVVELVILDNENDSEDDNVSCQNHGDDEDMIEVHEVSSSHGSVRITDPFIPVSIQDNEISIVPANDSERTLSSDERTVYGGINVRFYNKGITEGENEEEGSGLKDDVVYESCGENKIGSPSSQNGVSAKTSSTESQESSSVCRRGKKRTLQEKEYQGSQKRRKN